MTQVYTGIVKSEQIKEEISKLYNINIKDIKESWHSRNQEISYSFDFFCYDKYSTKRTVKLDNADVAKIVGGVCSDDGIKIKTIGPKEEHIDGDSFEPMDYGTYKFVGFEFTYDSEE